MIKKVIFDLDDTLFSTSKDARVAYTKFLKKYNFNCSEEELYESLEDINYMDDPSIEKYYLFLKKYLGESFNEEVFKDFGEMYINEANLICDKTNEVFEYLSNKYEIIILSNWFNLYQGAKIKNYDLDRYVTKVYGVDTIGRKPEVNVFIKVCSPYEFSECVIIGDSLMSDILVPKKLGMRAIYLGKSEDLECIDSILELKEIL